MSSSSCLAWSAASVGLADLRNIAPGEQDEDHAGRRDHRAGSAVQACVHAIDEGDVRLGGDGPAQVRGDCEAVRSSARR
jgi:hypothetical protein